MVVTYLNRVVVEIFILYEILGCNLVYKNNFCNGAKLLYTIVQNLLTNRSLYDSIMRFKCKRWLHNQKNS